MSGPWYNIPLDSVLCEVACPFSNMVKGDVGAVGRSSCLLLGVVVVEVLGLQLMLSLLSWLTSSCLEGAN